MHFLAVLLIVSLCGAWTHGAAPVVAPDVSCSYTGVATGVGSGTCISPPLACDGSADDTTALVSFNDWALNTWQASHTGLIELVLPVNGNCASIAGVSGGSSPKPFNGLKQFRLTANGSTFSTRGNPSAAGIEFGTVALPDRGIAEADGVSARINTVSAGATSACLTAASAAAGYISRVVAGRAVLIAGIDLQGAGSPQNPGISEFAEIASVDATTKCMTFTTALKYSYKSIWPLYNAGNAFQPDLGGPATVFVFPAEWNVTHAYNNINVDQNGQTHSRGRNITFNTMTATGSGGVIPSQNDNWICNSCTMTSEAMEVDKMISNLTLTNGTIYRVVYQSTSTNTLTATNYTFSSQLYGTPRVQTTLRNVTIADFRPGVTSYGVSGAVTCLAACTLPSFDVGGGVTQANLDSQFSMSGGVITIPPTLSVSGASGAGNCTGGGTGCVRLTVTTSAGQISGKNLVISGITGTTEANGTHAIAIPDGTHIDLPDVTFVHAYTGANNPVAGNTPVLWAVPGANITWKSGTFERTPPGFQVIDLSQDGNNATLITTSMTGGFPTPPSGTQLDVIAVAVPKMDCTGCTGSQLATDLANGAQNVSMFSAPSRTVVGNAATSLLPVWGTLQRLTFTVNTPYGGAGALTFSINDPFVIATDGHTKTDYNPVVNAKVAGIRRLVVGSGWTCDTGGGPVAGGCSGDSLGADPGPIWFVSSNQTTPKYSSTPADIGSTSATVTFQLDQGVSFP